MKKALEDIEVMMLKFLSERIPCSYLYAQKYYHKISVIILIDERILVAVQVHIRVGLAYAMSPILFLFMFTRLNLMLICYIFHLKMCKLLQLGFINCLKVFLI